MNKQYGIEQIIAFEHGHRLAKKIIRDYPEIAYDYRKNMTREAIIEKYDLTKKYRKNINLIALGITLALEKLVPRKELEIIRKKHRKQAASIGGNFCYLEKNGFMV